MALYLVGDEDINNPQSGIFYLDPHLIQPAVPSSEIEKKNPNFWNYRTTYHCTELRTLDPSDMCSSLAPGFYLRNQQDFEEWTMAIKSLQYKFKDQFIFSVFDRKPDFMREYETPAQ